MGYGVTSIVYASRPAGPGLITGANQILLIFGKVLDESTGNLTGNEILLWRGRTNTFTAGGNDPNAIEITEWESGSWNATFEEGDTATGSQTTQTPVDTSTASVSAHIVKNSVLTFDYAAPGDESATTYRVLLTNYAYYATPYMREPGIAVDIVDYVPAEVGLNENRDVQASAEYDKVASYRRAVIYEYVHIESFDVQLTGPKQFTATFSGTVYLVDTQNISSRVDLRLYAKELDGETVAESSIYALSPSYGTASGGAVPFSGSLVLTDNAGLIGYDLAKKYRFYADATIDSEIVYETDTLERWTQRKLTSPVIDGMNALDGVGSVRWGAVENAAGYRIALVDSKYAIPASSSSATSPWSFDETSSGTVVQGKYVRLQSVAVSTQYEYANSEWSEGVLIPDNRTPDDQEEEPVTPVEMIMTRRIYKAIPYIDVPVEQIGGGGSSAKDVITVEYADSHYAALGDAITPSTLPIAKDDELGAIKVGTHLSINSTTGVLSVSDNGAIASGNTGLVTGGTVYAETNKYAAFANKSIATSVTSGDSNPVTSGAVYTFVTTVSNLPKAKAAGGSGNAGVVYVTSASDKEGLIIDATNAGQIKVDFATYSAWSSTVANKVANPSYVKQAIEGYISAKAVSSSSGSSDATKLVKLNADGVIDSSMLKVVSVTNYFEAASESAMLDLSDAQDGDICVRTDESKTYILMSGGAQNGYATASNWKELTAPTGTVTSVNGKAGATVTLSISDIYASGSTKASIATSIGTPESETYALATAKAVYTALQGKSNTGHTHTSANISDSISDGENITNNATGLVQGQAVYDFVNDAINDLGLGTAATYGVTSSVTSGGTGLVTSDGVYTYIAGLNLSTTYAAKTHTHSLGQIIYSGETGYAAGTSISSGSTDGQLATAKAVYDYTPLLTRLKWTANQAVAGVYTGTATAPSSEDYKIASAYAVKQWIDTAAAGVEISVTANYGLTYSSKTLAITRANGTSTYGTVVQSSSANGLTISNGVISPTWASYSTTGDRTSTVKFVNPAYVNAYIADQASVEATADKLVKFDSGGYIDAFAIHTDSDLYVDFNTGDSGIGKLCVDRDSLLNGLASESWANGKFAQSTAMATGWSNSGSYSLGDVVSYNGKLYRKTGAGSGVPGMINSGWTEITLEQTLRYETTLTRTSSATTYDITHNLGSKYVEVQLFDSSDQEVVTAVTAYSANVVRVSFGASLDSGVTETYKVVVRK